MFMPFGGFASPALKYLGILVVVVIPAAKSLDEFIDIFCSAFDFCYRLPSKNVFLLAVDCLYLHNCL